MGSPEGNRDVETLSEDEFLSALTQLFGDNVESFLSHPSFKIGYGKEGWLVLCGLYEADGICFNFIRSDGGRVFILFQNGRVTVCQRTNPNNDQVIEAVKTYVQVVAQADNLGYGIPRSQEQHP